MMPNRVQWDANFTVGHDVMDEQHRHLVAQCNVLADLCAVDGGNSSADPQFIAAYDRLMTLAREHFSAEEALLVAGGFPDLEDYRFEIEEYGYLAAEIATAENFDRIELQRFLALWWVGHILGAAKQQRSFLGDNLS
jgi:hemerythrin-like metal-binding protein